MKARHLVNLTAGLALLVVVATGFAVNGKMSEKVKDKAQTGANGKVSVTVQHNTTPNQAEDNRLNRLGATEKRAYSELKMRALKIKANKLNSPANDSKVKYVFLHRLVP